MWPPEKRAGVVLSFDFDAEEVWLAEDPGNAHRPGVLSQGRYGAKVGVPLILDLLGEAGVHATFFVPGAVAARYPDRVREILAAGHEVGLHGYTHRSPTKLPKRKRRTSSAAPWRPCGRWAPTRRLPFALVGLQRAHARTARPREESSTRRT